MRQYAPSLRRVCAEFAPSSRQVRASMRRVRAEFAPSSRRYHFDILEAAGLLDLDIHKKDQPCIAAAKLGRLDLLQKAVNAGYKISAVTCGFAALNGHLALLKWALQAAKKGFRPGFSICELSVMGGYFALVKWAHEVGRCPLSESCKWHARKQPVILEWLNTKKMPLVRESADKENRRMKVYGVKYLQIEIISARRLHIFYEFYNCYKTF
jgi:hypothetical protein